MRRKYLTLASLEMILFLLSINVGCSSTKEGESDDLSLVQTIRQVAEAANVLPLDVYAGTTQEEYRGWNCRYDLTYKEFRLNYALCLIARNASVKEVLDCVKALPKMNPKEKALACAALIAFIEAQHEHELADLPQDSSNSKDKVILAFSENEKKFVLQKLENELKSQKVAFSKIASSNELSDIWEKNLREEFSNFMVFKSDPVTATHACHDLYFFPSREGEFLIEFPEVGPFTFAVWNNETKLFPVEFLCAMVLAHATHEQELWRDEILGKEGPAEEISLDERLETAKRDAVEKCFRYCKTSIVTEWEKTFPVKRRKFRSYDDGEALIMNAFLRTQFIASRWGSGEAQEKRTPPIDGSSSCKDVLVSEVAQKAIDAVHKKSLNVMASRTPEVGEERKNVEKTRLSLLKTIQNNADASTFFSLPLFIKMFETIEQKQKDVDLSQVRLPVTYERSRPFSIIYEAAKKASHDEIVECLGVFNELSNKEKAFVSAAVALYIVRSESSDELKSLVGEKELEPLSVEEKKLFTQLVKENDKSEIVFRALGGSDLEMLQEWETSFRKNAVEYQKILGKWNPYYKYSSDTEELWNRFCNEAPIVLLYSMLSMEILCDLDDLRVFSAGEKGGASNNENKGTTAFWMRNIDDDDLLAETKIMRNYLFLTRELSRRNPVRGAAGYSAFPPPPKYTRVCSQISLSDLAAQIRGKFPTMKNGGLPELDPSGRFGGSIDEYPY